MGRRVPLDLLARESGESQELRYLPTDHVDIRGRGRPVEDPNRSGSLANQIGKRRCAIALLSAMRLWVFGMPSLCLAQVQLPSVNLGLTNFEDGFGSPGWLFQEFPDFYHAGELKDSRGNALPGSNHVTSYSTTTHLVFVSQRRFLGGWFAAEALQPLVDLDTHVANAATVRVVDQAI